MMCMQVQIQPCNDPAVFCSGASGELADNQHGAVQGDPPAQSAQRRLRLRGRPAGHSLRQDVQRPAPQTEKPGMLCLLIYQSVGMLDGRKIFLAVTSAICLKANI